jgi:hypothetical protein
LKPIMTSRPKLSARNQLFEVHAPIRPGHAYHPYISVDLMVVGFCRRLTGPCVLRQLAKRKELGSLTMNTPWIFRLEPRLNPKLRLVCFPHAGRGPSMFNQ